MEEGLSKEARVLLQTRQEELIKLIEAMSKLNESKEWHVLKELVFDKSIEAIERQLLSESTKQEIEIKNLYRLQGELAWCKQYSDTGRFVETLKAQLQGIKNRLA